MDTIIGFFDDHGVRTTLEFLLLVFCLGATAQIQFLKERIVDMQSDITDIVTKLSENDPDPFID